AESGASDQRLARSARQHLKEIHLLGHDVDAQVRQTTVEAPAAPVGLRQMRGRDLADVLLIDPLAPARGGRVAHPAGAAGNSGGAVLVLVVGSHHAVESRMSDRYVI